MHDLSLDICNYINKEWMLIRKVPSGHLRKSMMWMKKMIRQIADSKNTPYRIGLYTLHKMYVARDITLEDFFGLIKR